MSESEEKELIEYLNEPEVRHLYVDSSIRQLLAMQLRKMREAREKSQDEIGDKAGMKQSAVARLEDPRYSSMTLATLKRLAKAFDVALMVHFAPFSEFIAWNTNLDEPHLSPPSFGDEYKPAAKIRVVNTTSDIAKKTEADDQATVDAAVRFMTSTADHETPVDGRIRRQEAPSAA